MKKKEHLLILYNQLVNIFWSVVCFTPLVMYWYAADAVAWLIIFLTVSLLAALLPEKFYQAIQLSRYKRFYERLGIKTVRKFAQNGDMINRLVQQRFPAHRLIKNRQSFRQYRKTLIMYERFHAVAFVFFFATTIHAVIHFHFGMALVITICNIVYNVFPLLLQQYNKIRLARLGRRGLLA